MTYDMEQAVSLLDGCSGNWLCLVVIIQHTSRYNQCGTCQIPAYVMAFAAPGCCLGRLPS